MIAGLKPYPRYKDSGVEWLGEVPEGWEVRPARSLFEERISKGHPDELMLSVTIDRGVLLQSDLIDQTPSKDESNEDRSGYKLVLSGDLVYNKMRAWQGAAGVSSIRGIVSPAYIVMRPRSGLTPDLVHRLVRTPQFCTEAERRSYGITSDQWSFRAKDFKQAYFPVPSRHEQSAMARLLDRADRLFMRMIKARQRLILLLEEEKQAVIHRAVTRGLDPNVRLKPSGVDWLGDVPESWEVRRLKDVTTTITSGSRGWSAYAADEGPRFIRIANLSRHSIDLRWDDTLRLSLPDQVREGEAMRTRVRPDDVLVSITAYIGSVGIVPPDLGESFVSQHVALCRPRTDIGIVPRWIAYVLVSPVGDTHGQLTMYGGTKQGMSLADVANYVVLVPPESEQHAITRLIDESLAAANAAAAQTKRQIALLEELRTRLISDVVTGKLDVREAAARLPADPDEGDPLLEEAVEEAVT